MRARNSVFLSWILVLFAAAAWPAFAEVVYAYDGPNLRIPAAIGSNIGPMNDATIEITEPLIITDLDVAIDIKHTNVWDLEIMLQGPNDIEICLNAYYDTESFFKEPDYCQTIFDDEAALAIEQGSAPFTGRFRPKSGNALSVFDGTNALGTWQLKIDDLYDDDDGFLENFELIITVPEPTTFVLFVLAGCLLRRRS